MHVHVYMSVASWLWCISVLAVRASISNLLAKGLKREDRKLQLICMELHVYLY